VSARLWPIAEAAQADYEQLRELVLAGGQLGEVLAARRFARRGLTGLISWPAAEPAFIGSVSGARRPPWSGIDDPREQQLRDTYTFLLSREIDGRSLKAVGQ
jgi:hypothetical protein